MTFTEMCVAWLPPIFGVIGYIIGLSDGMNLRPAIIKSLAKRDKEQKEKLDGNG